MEVDVAKSAGFCFGVRRAMELASQTAEDAKGKKVYSLGPLIHNPQAVEKLVSLGIGAIDSLDGADPGGIYIVRTHGLPPKIIEDARQDGITIVDGTCPFVSRAQRWAASLKADGYQVIVVGDPEHPEVIGIVGATDDTALVCKSPGDLEGLDLRRRVGVIAQTTQTFENFRRCVDKLLEKAEELKIYNTICTATTQRQEEAARMAREYPVMVVVGGRNSANTTNLAELCRKAGARTFHVETMDELDPAWFKGVKKAGVTGGASTPSWIIEGVVKKMNEFDNEALGVETNEEASKESRTPDEPAIEPAARPAAEAEKDIYSETFRSLSVGQIINAKVVQVQNDEVLVDIGYKSEGVIPLAELKDPPPAAASDVVSVGDEINVYVVKLDDGEGNVVLSKRRADAHKAWEYLREAKAKNETIEATVRERTKGGLLVDLGVRGFVPASHASREYVEDLSVFVGKKLPFKILELDEGRRNIVLSHKLVEEEEYLKTKKETFANLQEGAILDGVVKRLTNFGAFVDIGHGVEGLLHVSEIAWSRVKQPSDMLSIGQKIQVKVIGIDRENERISLSLKQAMPDPWSTVADRFQTGQIVHGEVTRVVDFGAFVRIADGLEGLVHVSQLADRHVAKPSDVVNVGDRVDAKILNIDPAAHRISLSIKEAHGALNQAAEKEAKEAVEGQTTEVAAPNDNNFTSLGEIAGNIDLPKLDRK
ncbi:MAG: bifunctional 4-hydroxy-3-methylbut-2-enyl diphosphate reductase/30S ribosomal protein S1 [Syntrophothermus sp.]